MERSEIRDRPRSSPRVFPHSAELVLGLAEGKTRGLHAGYEPLANNKIPIKDCGRRRPSPDRWSKKNRGAFMDLLRLVALETDVIDVVSAHVQDSVVKVADIM